MCWLRPTTAYLWFYPASMAFGEIPVVVLAEPSPDPWSISSGCNCDILMEYPPFYWIGFRNKNRCNPWNWLESTHQIPVMWLKQEQTTHLGMVTIPIKIVIWGMVYGIVSLPLLSIFHSVTCSALLHWLQVGIRTALWNQWVNGWYANFYRENPKVSIVRMSF